MPAASSSSALSPMNGSLPEARVVAAAPPSGLSDLERLLAHLTSDEVKKQVGKLRAQGWDSLPAHLFDVAG